MDRRARSVRDPEPGVDRQAAPLELGEGGVQIGHSVDQHRGFALQVIGEQKSRLVLAQPHLRDPGGEGLDREHDLGAEVVSIERQVRGHGPARHVQEVERVERRCPSLWLAHLRPSVSAFAGAPRAGGRASRAGTGSRRRRARA